MVNMNNQRRTSISPRQEKKKTIVDPVRTPDTLCTHLCGEISRKPALPIYDNYCTYYVFSHVLSVVECVYIVSDTVLQTARDFYESFLNSRRFIFITIIVYIYTISSYIFERSAHERACAHDKSTDKSGEFLSFMAMTNTIVTDHCSSARPQS